MLFKTRNKMNKIVFIIMIFMTLFSKAFSQEPLPVVKEVDLKKYSGTWFEIARLPNRFEKGLKCITATYTLRDDGKITVLNRGHRINDPSKVSSIRGVAFIPDSNSPAKLKVQFFWPFSGDYWIIELDRDYRYVLVGNPSRKYLWILARDKNPGEDIIRMLLEKAAGYGFDTKSVIRAEHDC